MFIDSWTKPERQKNRRVCLRSRSFRKKLPLYRCPIHPILPHVEATNHSSFAFQIGSFYSVACALNSVNSCAFSSGWCGWPDQKSGVKTSWGWYFLAFFLTSFYVFLLYLFNTSQNFIRISEASTVWTMPIFSAWGRVSSQKVNGPCSTSCNDLFEGVVISSQTSKPLQRRNKNSHRSPDVTDKSYQVMMQLA